jgi:hypothetical protein
VEQSKRSSKWLDKDAGEWLKFPTYDIKLGSLCTMAKAGNIDEYERIVLTLNDTKDIFEDDAVYPCTVINTPYLTTKAEQRKGNAPRSSEVQGDRGRSS